MTKLVSKSLPRVLRGIIVLLVIAAIPLSLTHRASACIDPLNHWVAGDQAIQSVQSQAIQRGIADTHATYGLAITIDGSNGHVISYYRSGVPQRCADAWEPGSIMKPLTVAAAIDSDSISPDYSYYDTGSLTIDHRTITNWKAFPQGTKDLRTILSDSLNTGAVSVVSHMDGQTWHNYQHNRYRLDVGGHGYLPHNHGPQARYRYAISSFGIGIVTTPLQMSLAYAALINGGYYHDACWQKVCNQPGTRVIKPTTSDMMTQLLSTTYDRTNTQSKPPATLVVGGKSGTAPLVQPSGEYIADHNSGTYVGFVKYNGKTYIQLVRLDNPQDPIAASHSARNAWQRTLPAYSHLQ